MVLASLLPRVGLGLHYTKDRPIFTKESLLASFVGCGFDLAVADSVNVSLEV